MAPTKLDTIVAAATPSQDHDAENVGSDVPDDWDDLTVSDAESEPFILIGGRAPNHLLRNPKESEGGSEKCSYSVPSSPTTATTTAHHREKPPPVLEQRDTASPSESTARATTKTEAQPFRKDLNLPHNLVWVTSMIQLSWESQQELTPPNSVLTPLIKNLPFKTTFDLEALVEKQDVVAEHWNDLVQRVRATGTLEGCIAFRDRSCIKADFLTGGIKEPMYASISLPILMANVNDLGIDEVLEGKEVLRKRPANAPPPRLWPTIQNMMRKTVPRFYGTSRSIDIEDVLMFLLKQTVRNSPASPMPKRVYIFTHRALDDSFFRNYHRNENDRSVPHLGWDRSWERLSILFGQAKCTLPHVIFWNLKSPPYGEKPFDRNVSVVGGYSDHVVRKFLEEGKYDGSPGSDDMVLG